MMASEKWLKGKQDVLGGNNVLSLPWGVSYVVEYVCKSLY